MLNFPLERACVNNWTSPQGVSLVPALRVYASQQDQPQSCQAHNSSATRSNLPCSLEKGGPIRPGEAHQTPITCLFSGIAACQGVEPRWRSTWRRVGIAAEHPSRSWTSPYKQSPCVGYAVAESRMKQWRDNQLSPPGIRREHAVIPQQWTSRRRSLQRSPRGMILFRHLAFAASTP